MFIGDTLKQRMLSLGYDMNRLSKESTVDIHIVNGLLNNALSIKQVHEVDMDYICQVLMCEPIYFTNPFIREKDMVYNSPKQEVKSNRVKANLISFTNDFSFIMELSKECKSNNNKHYR
ncbi:hypothetical protein [Bacillus thuringiensis]|uniref:hypothetical protein n=1 Tax=Bacillus thuringiensis TaxID=1428 RepID=UPI0021B4BDFD|nr:hypothetical protein [Bacillus thuringiensis]